MQTSDFLVFLIAALAVYRLGRLFAYEDGPLDIFMGLRLTLGAYETDETGTPKGTLGRLAVCPCCWGLWFGLFFTVILMPPYWFVWWLGICGLQVALPNR